MSHNHAARNTGKIYLTDRFSICMCKNSDEHHSIDFWPADPSDIPPTVISVIGQSDTAAAVSADLGFPVPAQTPPVELTPDDTVFIVQASDCQPSEYHAPVKTRTALTYLQMRMIR